MLHNTTVRISYRVLALFGFDNLKLALPFNG